MNNLAWNKENESIAIFPSFSLAAHICFTDVWVLVFSFCQAHWMCECRRKWVTDYSWHIKRHELELKVTMCVCVCVFLYGRRKLTMHELGSRFSNAWNRSFSLVLPLFIHAHTHTPRKWRHFPLEIHYRPISFFSLRIFVSFKKFLFMLTSLN